MAKQKTYLDCRPKDRLKKNSLYRDEFGDVYKYRFNSGQFTWMLWNDKLGWKNKHELVGLTAL